MADIAEKSTAEAGSNGIVCGSRGLSVAGTRITLYDLMDYVTAGWSAEQMYEALSLSRQQIDAALAYIEAHRREVEADYRRILQRARAEQAYWEERNRERTERIRREPPPPEKAALVARLRKQMGLTNP